MDEDGALPEAFAPAKMAANGIEVLTHGLPDLRSRLTRQMAIPMAFWETAGCAVVLFCRYREFTDNPIALMATYTRQHDRWVADEHWAGVGWRDVITQPDPSRELSGRVIVEGGGSSSRQQPAPGKLAVVITGSVSPAVTTLAIVQDGREVRRDLHSHFGAWVVCTETWAPYRIEALSQGGKIIGTIYGQPH